MTVLFEYVITPNGKYVGSGRKPLDSFVSQADSLEELRKHFGEILEHYLEAFPERLIQLTEKEWNEKYE